MVHNHWNPTGGVYGTLKTNWENIGLSNDFLFGKIMRKPALCKRMLEIILGVKIDRLEYLES